MYLKGSSLAILIFLFGIFAFQNDSDARKRGKGIFFLNFGTQTIGERSDAKAQDFLFLMGQADKEISPDADTSKLAGLKVGYK